MCVCSLQLSNKPLVRLAVVPQSVKIEKMKYTALLIQILLKPWTYRDVLPFFRLTETVIEVGTTNSTQGSTIQPLQTVQQTATVLVTELNINGSTVQTTVVVTPSIKATRTSAAGVPAATVISVSGQSLSPSRSKAKLAGIISGVLGALIICLVILLCIRRRMIRKGAIARSKLHAAPHRNERTVMPLSLTEASGQRSWTGKHNRRQAETTGIRTKLVSFVSKIVPESSKATVEPMSSMVQEMDSLRARIAHLERQRQQDARRNLHPPSIHSNGTGDNQSAPPAYSDDGRQ
ncbi:uncharacterized protein FOMMEDRAFT_156210 [Fomitiporia mediterranea MF3/22]|uniref:uncharacterized protein n=1 Tax=Fomitiporia mediterranea (strain MF3/22) TaxID=694068 RepID=UPI00044075E0|nr:uncharacterized protein FOMMEDRAFT_156210 [Fomitiporia mediterranea MF3/22]EJD02853.1 hypothetical protein FOMMEDRAFT_156210 [Fomitiporia mediterranea MF3/22]